MTCESSSVALREKVCSSGVKTKYCKAPTFSKDFTPGDSHLFKTPEGEANLRRMRNTALLPLPLWVTFNAPTGKSPHLSMPVLIPMEKSETTRFALWQFCCRQRPAPLERFRQNGSFDC